MGSHSDAAGRPPARSPVAPGGAFVTCRVKEPSDLPPPSEWVVDVALLDMNHEWPNLGHDSVVAAVQNAVGPIADELERAGLTVRLVSFEVRKRHMLPEPPPGRYGLYLGTGGPGHIDPDQNDGQAMWAQGIIEDAGWRPGLTRLFRQLIVDDDAAFIAICHTFGLLCYLTGVAEPRLRGPEKGGKSAGVVENVLTEEGRRHPWFSRLAAALPDGRHLKIADSRFFDLIPGDGDLPYGAVAIGHECPVSGGEPGNALTMVEIARDSEGVMPRIWAVNHHPEVFDQAIQRRLLADKLARGEVTEAWHQERVATLDSLKDPDAQRALRVTSRFTLLDPLRYHLHRLVRRRAHQLGIDIDVHEDRVLEAADPAPPV